MAQITVRSTLEVEEWLAPRRLPTIINYYDSKSYFSAEIKLTTKPASNAYTKAKSKLVASVLLDFVTKSRIFKYVKRFLENSLFCIIFK